MRRITILTVLLLAALVLFSACNDTVSTEPELPSEQLIVSGTSAVSEPQSRSCNCEELEYQIDAVNHPDLPKDMKFQEVPWIIPVDFEESVNDGNCLILATFKRVGYESAFRFDLNFVVDKVYKGEADCGEEITVEFNRYMYEALPENVCGGVYYKFQSVLCPYEVDRQYLLVLYDSKVYFATPHHYSVIPADDLKHSRLCGEWVKDLTDFDLENCESVDEFAQYTLNFFDS